MTLRMHALTVALAVGAALAVGLGLLPLAEAAPSGDDLAGLGLLAGGLGAVVATGLLGWLLRSGRARAARPLQAVAMALAGAEGVLAVTLPIPVATGRVTPSEAALLAASFAALAVVVATGFLRSRAPPPRGAATAK